MFQTITFFGAIFLEYFLPFIVLAWLRSRKWKVLAVVLITLWISWSLTSMANTISWSFWFFNRSLDEIGVLAENGEIKRIQPLLNQYFQENQMRGIFETENLCIQICLDAQEGDPQLPSYFGRAYFSKPISVTESPFWFPNWQHFPELFLIHCLVGTTLLVAAIFARHLIFVLFYMFFVFIAAVWLWTCGVHALPYYESCHQVLAAIHYVIEENREEDLAIQLKKLPAPPSQTSACGFYMSPEGQGLLKQLASDLRNNEKQNKNTVSQ